MRTLYEVLEVSENASKEIIEKAYRVLAKRYHPDLQTEANRQDAENKMKEINEAYDILSDEQKRQEYNKKIELQRQEERSAQYNQNNTSTNQQEQRQTSYDNRPNQTYSQKQANYGGAQTQERHNPQQRPMTEAEYQEIKRRQEELIKQQQAAEQKRKQEMQAKYEQKYQEAYEGYLRNLGYRIKYKWTWSRFKDFLITILIMVAIGFIFWIFPPTHKWLVAFYESNPIFKAIIDVIGRIFVGFWNAICTFFKGDATL